MRLVTILSVGFLLPACAVDPQAPQGTQDENISSSEYSIGLEEPPPPGSGGLGGPPGSDHTGGPGDGYHHSLCDDPQYASLCDPHRLAPPTNPPRSLSVEQIAASQKARKNLEGRGWNYIKKYEDLGKGHEEALLLACIDSCTMNYQALCGQIESACITGTSDISMSPGVITPCANALNAACMNKPNMCLVGCFSGATNPCYAKLHPSNAKPPIGVSPKWRKSCHRGCDMVTGLSCVGMTLACAAGAFGTAGGDLPPCVLLVAAACGFEQYPAKWSCDDWCDTN